MTAPLQGYRAIDPRYLLADNLSTSFDIYIIQRHNGRLTPVLLIGRETPIFSVRDTLAAKANIIGQLYIKDEECTDFQQFMEESLQVLIADHALSAARKSQVVYDCARNVLRDVFDDPRSGTNLARTKRVTNNMVDFILENEHSIIGLLQLGSHDYYTFSHCVNVAVFSLGLWLMMGRGDDFDLRDFTLGCILHDVGKTTIAGHILKKPGRLTAAEFTEIKKHPRNGYELMRNCLPPIALDVILHHHEKDNGDGYPDGLTGDMISDHAKVAAIADVYDALTTNRPYCTARPPFKAILTMKEEMVGHFEQEKFLKFIRFLGGDRE